MSTIPTIPSNETVSDIFTNKTMIYMLFFLVIYSVIYYILGILFGGSTESNGQLKIIRIIDIFIILIIIIFIIINYSGSSVNTFSTSLLNYLKSFKVFADDPYSIFNVIIFLVALYSVIYFIKIPMTSELKPISIMFLETMTILLFIILLIIDFFKYLLKIDLMDLILDAMINGLDKKPVATTAPIALITPIAPTKPPEEVFNIRNNLYSYDDAREVCSVYGAKLATYDQIEEAYNNGAEWCNYGWSEGQMALFPTQKNTWKSLQSNKKTCKGNKIRDTTNNTCGRPGINGGIIKNPNVRFGVNCYGKKPEATDSDKSLMSAQVESKVTESPKDAELHAKLEVWKKNSDKFLLVNSFNKDKWSAK